MSGGPWWQAVTAGAGGGPAQLCRSQPARPTPAAPSRRLKGTRLSRGTGRRETLGVLRLTERGSRSTRRQGRTAASQTRHRLPRSGRGLTEAPAGPPAAPPSAPVKEPRALRGRAGVTAPDTPAPLAGDRRRHRGSWCGGSSEIKTRKNQRPRKNKKVMCSLTAEEKGEMGPTADGNRLRWPQSSGPTPPRTRGTSGLTHSPPRLRPPLRCGCRGTDSARSRRL